MKTFKYLVGLIFALVFLFIVVANFSTSTESYRCDGVLTNEDETIEIPLFFELNRYRFWVGLWSGSYGDFEYEIPNTTVGTFLHLDKVGNQIQIYEKHPTLSLQGNFSTLSKTLTLNIGYFGFFDGECVTL
jgi:hypothetical protein